MCYRKLAQRVPSRVLPHAVKDERTGMFFHVVTGTVMPIEHHDLQHDFPEGHDRIHAQTPRHAHVATLFDEYHQVDREVRRIEQEIETPSDAYTEELKMRRVKLKDALYAMLRA